MRGEKISFKCENCGTDCERLLSHYKRTKDHFCSKKCAYEFKEKNCYTYNTCKYCGKQFKLKPSRNKQQYCSMDCKNKWQSENVRGENHPSYSKIKYNCDCCGKEILISPFDIKHAIKHFCDDKCKREYFSKKPSNIKICKICGQEKPIEEFASQSNKCYVCQYLNKHSDLIILPNWTLDEYKIILDNLYNKRVNCVNEILPILNNKSLDNLVDVLYILKITLQNYSIRIKRNCLNCGKEFYCNVSEYKNGVGLFCSKDCSYNNLHLNNCGEKNSRWNRVKCNCDWCGKEFTTKNYQYQNNEHNFCSMDCKQEYFKNVTIKTDEWKNQLRNVALNNLQNGAWNTDTDIQKIINDSLRKNNINFDNEITFGYYSVDNYLKDYNLIIELQGDYFHCNVNKYSIINYEMQVDRIYRDKAKHSYILNNCNINVLYLWEYDIKNNLDICEALISRYIENKGVLKNYNSFNYSFINNKLKLNKTIIKSYQECKNTEISDHIDLSIKEKPEFYIHYLCENCGEECSQLISKYQKQNHHFCSRKCSGDYKKMIGSKIVKCDYCGKEVNKKNSELINHENNFCGKECYDNWQRDNGIWIDVVCNNCDEHFKIKKCSYEKNITKTFYCSQKCYREKIKQKNIICNCEYCGKEIIKPEVNYNKNKHHFCNLSCATAYNNKHRKVKELNIDINLESA
jgi:very-short-patch-repair endonuclease